MQERKVGKSRVNRLALNDVAEMMPTMNLLLLITREEEEKIKYENNPNVPIALTEERAERIEIYREVYQRKVGLTQSGRKVR
jgi:hypothetical protein